MYDNLTADSGRTCARWRQDLALHIKETDWVRINTTAHTCSPKISMQETAYKILNRWYRTPATLHKIYSGTSEKCWRCQREEGTLLHTWWSCDLIEPFLQQVHDRIKVITGTSPAFTPAQYLLQYDPYDFNYVGEIIYDAPYKRS